MPRGKKAIPIDKRWPQHVEEKGPEDCWPWKLKRVDQAGCPRMAHIHPVTGKRTSISVARLAYQKAKGPIPEKHEVFHVCGHKKCMNPAHLSTRPEGTACGIRFQKRINHKPTCVGIDPDFDA